MLRENLDGHIYQIRAIGLGLGVVLVVEVLNVSTVRALSLFEKSSLSTSSRALVGLYLLFSFLFGIPLQFRMYLTEKAGRSLAVAVTRHGFGPQDVEFFLST